ncbi:hypothetical protein SBBP1_1330005 [Burkholderiales bacterium]|nr:hypothetical protein SBBP1_1330005 [Burkholderiales bacterium]
MGVRAQGTIARGATIWTPVVGHAAAPVGHAHYFVDGPASSHYDFGMVTFCKNCAKVFVSVPRPGFLSLRLLRCKCGHSQIVTVRSLLDDPAVPASGREFPGFREFPPPR